jgi:hypothetical protein
MRHWEQLKKDGDFWYGEFETDETDWRLAELIVNIQYACQRHFFGAMAEAYFDNKLRDANVNVRRSKKTSEAFSRLADEFTTEDVMRVFNLNSSGSARMKICRLLKDHLIERIGEFKEGPFKGSFRKTGIILS